MDNYYDSEKRKKSKRLSAKWIFYGGLGIITIFCVAMIFLISWENKNATYTDRWEDWEVVILPNNEAMLYKSDLSDSLHIRCVDIECIRDQVIEINNPLKVLP